MLFVLLAISILMIATEKAKIDDFLKKGKMPAVIGMLFALFVFFLSGIFGIIIFQVPVDSPIFLIKTQKNHLFYLLQQEVLAEFLYQLFLVLLLQPAL